MDFDEKYRQQNNFQALPLELGLQLCGTALGYIFALQVPVGLVRIPQSHFWSIIVIQVLRTLVVILTSGRDSNHLVYKTAPKDLNWVLVGPEFHCLHHVYPDRYIGSFIKLFDWICGTAYSFRGKRFVITESGPFGQAMVTELEREGVQDIRSLKFGTDWDHHHLEKAAEALITCDILILAHDTEGDDAKSNCDSAVRLVQLFKEHRTNENSNPTLPEVWYVDSEIETHQSFKITQLHGDSNSNVRFLPHARSYYDDPDILYRHIVASGLQSSMVSAMPSAVWAAKCSMWWIRRGARYISVSNTGFAFLNYFKFMYLVPYAQEVDRA
ncbi:hypothetical protein N7491_006532 [Penicillium cf. griseofulvum]|uniref:Uncharacterized protein n=1 Tax=Penicillium cf. griseofulvum TaxID=2972120 RepID=A0A9W9IVM0_9EURO|nr:hypothetical protein N7472_010440 [Penicillium cf. griseofulvum]KAJ5429516.1 hypothetical protein N7491_006532 [Penicillium cf. griseofulvum]